MSLLLPTFLRTSATVTQVRKSQVDLEGAIMIYTLDVSAAAEWRLFQQAILLQHDPSFCVLLNLGEDPSVLENQSIIDLFISLTFHTAYYCDEPNVPRIFLQGNKQLIRRYSGIITNAALGQGYRTVNICDPSDTDANIFITGASSSLREDHQRLLASDFGVHGSMMISLNEESPAGVISQLRESEREFGQAFPVILALLNSQQELRARIRLQLFEQEDLEEQLRSSSSFSNAGSNNQFRARQVLEIVEFYKYEYEILPKWFKRTGHLIKVLTGKRTFKSLFNDNVKKYRH